MMCRSRLANGIGLRVWARALLWSSVVVLASSWASAYPQYVGQSEFNCSDCHYNPTGGGLLNEWGRDSRSALYGDDDAWGGSPSEWWGHADADGQNDQGKNTLEADVGGDLRVLGIAGPAFVFVPMFLEVGAVGTYGKFLLYGSTNATKGTPGLPVVAQSREHWLMYSFLPGLSLRVGKMTLPFGLKTVDHTQYTREGFGFDKGQGSYALESDWVRDEVTVSVAAFVGDVVTDDTDLRESGGAVRATYLVAKRLELGLSGILSDSRARERLALNASLRLNLFSNGYLMGEIAQQEYQAKRSDERLKMLATSGRAGYFIRPELDLFVEAGHRRVADVEMLNRYRYGAGANWQAWHWLEVIPQVLIENQKLVGSQFVGLVQAHVMY